MAGQEQDPGATPEAPDKPRNVGAAWSAEEERRLHDGFATLADIPALAARHARTPGGIRSRLTALGLLDEDGQAVTPKPPFTPSAQSLRRAARPWQPAPAPGSDPTDAAPPEALFLALLARLGPRRRALAMEVLRGLVALEAAAGDAFDCAGTDGSGNGTDGVPAGAAPSPGGDR